MFLDEFRLHNLLYPPIIPKVCNLVKWEKPPAGVIKVNVDATWNGEGAGIGVVARDSDGLVIGGCTCFVENLSTCEWVEVEAVKAGCLWALENDLNDVIIESDCASIINKLNSKKEDLTVLDYFITKVKNLVPHGLNFKFNWGARSMNKLAGRLSEMAIRDRSNTFFNMDYPSQIHNTVICDSI